MIKLSQIYNHFVKGGFELSSTFFHGLVQCNNLPISAQNSSGWDIDFW